MRRAPAPDDHRARGEAQVSLRDARIGANRTLPGALLSPACRRGTGYDRAPAAARGMSVAVASCPSERATLPSTSICRSVRRSPARGTGAGLRHRGRSRRRGRVRDSCEASDGADHLMDDGQGPLPVAALRPTSGFVAAAPPASWLAPEAGPPALFVMSGQTDDERVPWPTGLI
jgi:hypothetical protein